MRYSATLVALLPMMGGLSALAMPAETVKVSKPTAAPYRPALMARDDPDMTYIGIGLNVTVEIDGKSKTCDSIADNDNCMFTLAPDKTDGAEVFISWPAGIPPYNLQKNNVSLRHPRQTQLIGVHVDGDSFWWCRIHDGRLGVLDPLDGGWDCREQRRHLCVRSSAYERSMSPSYDVQPSTILMSEAAASLIHTHT